jgi:hypothetical protein
MDHGLSGKHGGCKQGQSNSLPARLLNCYQGLILVLVTRLFSVFKLAVQSVESWTVSDFGRRYATGRARTTPEGMEGWAG